jgi:hypothetical protein
MGTAFWVTSVGAVLVLLVAGMFGSSSRLVSGPAFVLLLLLVAGLLASTYANGVGRDNALRDSYVSTTTLPYVAFEGEEDNEPQGNPTIGYCCAQTGKFLSHFLWTPSGT